MKTRITRKVSRRGAPERRGKEKGRSIGEQCLKTGLREMMIRRERGGDVSFAHDFERNAIGQRPEFVASRVEKVDRRAEQFMRDGHNRDVGGLGGPSPECRSKRAETRLRRERVEDFELYRGARHNVSIDRKRRGTPMVLVGRIQQSQPVESVGKGFGHGDFDQVASISLPASIPLAEPWR